LFFDADDGFTEGAMQRWIVGKVLADGVANTHELTLDQALLGFTSCRQQDLAIACCQTLLATRDRVRCETQSASERIGYRANRLVRGTSREVECDDQHGQKDDCRQSGPRRDRQQTGHGHVTAPMLSGYSFCAWPFMRQRAGKRRQSPPDL